MAEILASNIEERIVEWLRSQSSGLSAPGGDFVVGTSVGSARADNQDRVVSGRFWPGEGGPAEFAILCDGMGGMVEGGRCAELALSSFVAFLISSPGTEGPAALLKEATYRANDRVFNAFRGRGGTTLSAMLTYRRSLYVSHVGDSRIYLLPEHGPLGQISRDDTVKAQLDALGVSSGARIADHERLVQFVGMGPDLEPQSLDVAIGAPCRAIILSDGIYRPAAPILETLAKHAPSARHLADRLLRLASWLGGSDNATIVCRDLGLTNPPLVQDRAVVSLWGPTRDIEIWRSAPPLVAHRAGPARPPDDAVLVQRVQQVIGRPSAGNPIKTEDARRRGKGMAPSKGKKSKRKVPEGGVFKHVDARPIDAQSDRGGQLEFGIPPTDAVLNFPDMPELSEKPRRDKD